MSTASPPLDLAAKYDQDASRLQGMVSQNISAPPELIEEACQIAWSRLHGRAGEVPPQSAFGWLLTTALRETLLQLRLRDRDVRLDDPGALAQVISLPAREPGPDGLTELHERLAEVRELPVRQQRMVWLHGFGYDYQEIAVHTGSTRRTVERQLARARRRLTTSDQPHTGPPSAL
jgi:RNA polymerase sigma factor (sigma-70 family)